MLPFTGLFRRFIPQLLHMIVLPIFFFVFILIYHPFDTVEFMGKDWFAVHLTIISCIILLCIILMRLLFYFLPLRLNLAIYIFWCLLEVIFTSLFVALYLWLAVHRELPYFEVVASSFEYLFFSLVIPYTILALSIRLYEYNDKFNNPEETTAQRMRFYDDRHNLKFVITPESLLYIAAEENYINIFYTENGKEKTYALRSSMKAVEELCLDNGMVRCHRSFYINPRHVDVLRKDKEGVMYAELDAKESRHVPVSKTYYKILSEKLY
ncbi:MAG: LytTR family transcriptional regulator [Bacteroidales bacterium]|nr:LytTR family transcriptional regulator [Bacteroidales bacterium]MBQ8500484.1 LytTR family transcriptional regulator [Bacteroidales bacterium]